MGGKDESRGLVMYIKTSSVIAISIVAVIIIAVVGFVAYPAFTTSTLKIKYISGGSNPMNPSENDSIDNGGAILVHVDCEMNLSLTPTGIHGAYHADQYIMFSGLSIGKHRIDIYRPDNSDLAEKDITSHAAILGDTVVDLHFADGFL